MFPGRQGEGVEVPAAAGGGEHGHGDGRPRLPPPQVPRPQAPIPRPRLLREGENKEKCVDNGYKCQQNFTKVFTDFKAPKSRMMPEFFEYCENLREISLTALVDNGYVYLWLCSTATTC